LYTSACGRGSGFGNPNAIRYSNTTNFSYDEQNKLIVKYISSLVSEEENALLIKCHDFEEIKCGL